MVLQLVSKRNLFQQFPFTRFNPINGKKACFTNQQAKVVEDGNLAHTGLPKGCPTERLRTPGCYRDFPRILDLYRGRHFVGVRRRRARVTYW